MTSAKHRMLASFAGAAAIALAALSFVNLAGASAETGPNPHDQGGPVIYMSNHAGELNCALDVSGIKADGNSYKDTIKRPSCDGTLWLPELQQNTTLRVTAWRKVNASEYKEKQDKIFSVVKSRTESGDSQNAVDNDTAICFLATPIQRLYYTNMSEKYDGDCNGD